MSGSICTLFAPFASLEMALAFVCDPLKEAEELREQLSSDKRRLLFLFGAGTSQAVGLDGIVSLTTNIANDLGGPHKVHFQRVLIELGKGATVETALDRVRLCRQLIGNTDGEAGGFKGRQASDLDREICKAIYKRVKPDPPRGFTTHALFASWLNSIPRSRPPEIFTTNYDLLVERALEIAEVPYFDGFLGAVAPYFSDVSVEYDDGKSGGVGPPPGWTRLWKLHGSIGWRSMTEPLTGSKRVVRLPLLDESSNEDFMIFPSKEKYADSRKLPFIALQDRLRRATSVGECMLVVAGYSFGDEHLNEIIFRSLRANNRLHVAVLSFDDLDTLSSSLLKPTTGARNLTVYAPDKLSVAGAIAQWKEPSPHPAGSDWPFWNAAKKRFTLGDFSAFANFLIQFFGVETTIKHPTELAKKTA